MSQREREREKKTYGLTMAMIDEQRLRPCMCICIVSLSAVVGMYLCQNTAPHHHLLRETKSQKCTRYIV